MSEEVIVGCNCGYWEDGIKQINSHITMSAFRFAGPKKYTAPKFRFCPWCGRALKEVK